MIVGLEVHRPGVSGVASLPADSVKEKKNDTRENASRAQGGNNSVSTDSSTGAYKELHNVSTENCRMCQQRAAGCFSRGTCEAHDTVAMWAVCAPQAIPATIPSWLAGPASSGHGGDQLVAGMVGTLRTACCGDSKSESLLGALKLGLQHTEA